MKLPLVLVFGLSIALSGKSREPLFAYDPNHGALAASDDVVIMNKFEVKDSHLPPASSWLEREAEKLLTQVKLDARERKLRSVAEMIDGPEGMSRMPTFVNDACIVKKLRGGISFSLFDTDTTLYLNKNIWKHKISGNPNELIILRVSRGLNLIYDLKF